jgi:voltage-gated potassium channel
VVSPYSFAGQPIAQSLFGPHVVSFLDTATTHLGMDLEIGEMHITSTVAFAGKTMESSRIRQERGVIVLAIKRREDMPFNPAPEERIEPDDCLIARGEPAQLRQLELTATSKS